MAQTNSKQAPSKRVASEKPGRAAIAHATTGSRFMQKSLPMSELVRPEAPVGKQPEWLPFTMPLPLDVKQLLEKPERIPQHDVMRKPGGSPASSASASPASSASTSPSTSPTGGGGKKTKGRRPRVSGSTNTTAAPAKKKRAARPSTRPPLKPLAAPAQPRTASAPPSAHKKARKKTESANGGVHALNITATASSSPAAPPASPRKSHARSDALKLRTSEGSQDETLALLLGLTGLKPRSRSFEIASPNRFLAEHSSPRRALVCV